MNCILFGEQYPMLKKQLNKLLVERLGEPNDFNVTKYDASEDDLDEVVNDCYYLPLGVERKAVVVDNVNFLGKTAKKEIVDKFTEMVKTPSDEVDVYFVVREGEINEKLELVQEVKQNGRIIACVNITAEQWPAYVRKFFNDRNVQIDYDAINEIVTRVDGDLQKFLNEGKKLVLYKDHITLADVCLMVAKPIEDDVFQLSNALLRGDKASALDIYRGLQLLGSRATDTLLPMLANQFRFMSQCLYLNKKEGLVAADIATTLGVKEGRVKITLRNARNCHLDSKSISQVLDNLYKLDYKIKSGQIDRFYGFELFLINFPN